MIFLKIKNITKQEIQDYLKNNTLDVTEVKFSGQTLRPNKEVQKMVDDYEARWRDSDIADAARPDYDNYKVNISDSPLNKAGEGKMDYEI